MILALPASPPHSALLSSKLISFLPQRFTHCCSLCPECSSHSILEASDPGSGQLAAVSRPPSFSSLCSPSYSGISHMFCTILFTVFPSKLEAPPPPPPPAPRTKISFVVFTVVSPCLARRACWTDVFGMTECIGLRTVLSTPSSEQGAGPECGAGWCPSSSCAQASLVAPLCIAVSCDLPKHPAPTPIYFPTQSLGGMVFG